MLIIPLQRRLGLASFPWVTLGLLLANVFVYFVLQSGDAAVRERAVAMYRSAGLGEIEEPPYLRWLSTHGADETAKQLAALEEPDRTQWIVTVMQNDSVFLAALAAGEIVAASDPRYEDWKRKRRLFEKEWDSAFTDRHLMRYDEPSFGTMLSSMFLHGGAEHLIGNMVFLVMLGLLVEAALGSGLFLGVYLVGGLGACALSLLRHYGDANGLLGASGAIAALMGAFCVLWGLRKVRVFWWFFVVFNYARITALWLLPLWLGWELFNLYSEPGANVAFDAHAGGIITGALLAVVIRELHWERREYLDGEAQQDDAAQRFDSAMGHLGRLEFARARAAFGELAVARPDDLAVLLPLYRSWRNEPARAEFHDAARRVLLRLTTRHEDMAQVAATFSDYLAATARKPRLKPEEILQIARRFTQASLYAESERLLTALSARAPVPAAVADALLDLVLAQRQRNREPDAKRVLTLLHARCADTPAGEKAGFLLANG